MKVVNFESKPSKNIEELKQILEDGKFKSFLFAGYKTDGEIVTFSSNSSLLEQCGLLAYLEVDLKAQIKG